jgi:glycosyltransferase involved in cell wall biosynthesis
MKILFTHDVFSTQKFGGVSRGFIEMIKRLRRMRSDSTFDIYSGLYINQYLKGLTSNWGLNIPAMKNTGFIRKKVNDVSQEIFITIMKPNIIHQTYYSAFSFARNMKTVITVPDMIHEMYPRMFSDKGITSYFKRKCCERAGTIIAISNTTKNDLVRLFGIESAKIQVIYLANALEGVSPDLKEKPAVPNYILYVGDRHGYKNFMGLIYAYAHSERIKKSFFLVCFGGGEFSPNEKNEIRLLGLDKHLIQINGNDRKLALYYQNARALVYSSLYEGFGLPLLEAMSYRCPIICSDAGSLAETAGNAAIYFDPKIPDSIQVTLEESLFNDGLLKETAHEGIKRNRLFSWEKCAQETLNVYKCLYDN